MFTRSGWILFLFPQQQTDGSPRQLEGLAEIVFQIALVGEVHQLFIVDKQRKGRRLNGHLGAVVDLQPAAVLGVV